MTQRRYRPLIYAPVRKGSKQERVLRMPKDYGELHEYLKTFYKSERVSLTQLGYGDTVSFTYKAKLAPEAGELYRVALVLHPDWMGKMHALELTKIPIPDLLGKFINPLIGRQNPYEFYHSHKGVWTEYDAYRTFLVNRIQNITRY